MTTPATKPDQSGFTLLEVLVAVAILAVSLSSLMGSQLNSMAATSYARDLTAAALLGEYQLIELEFKQQRDGWVNSDVEVEGDFSDHGYPNMEFTCIVHFIELPEYDQLLTAKEGADKAEGKDGDNIMDAGDQAFGALGMVWPMVKAAIENSIRKADCTVTWTRGTIEEEFTVQTFWTNPAGLQQLPGAGGEFSEQDDNSGSDGGAGGSSGPGGGGGGGGRGGSGPPTRPGVGGPGGASGGMMGGG